LAWPVFAGEHKDISYQSDQYVIAHRGLYNAPVRTETPESVKGSCVLFARWFTGRTDIRGNAWVIEPTGQIPKVGLVVLTTEGPGHLAVITDIIGYNLILVEANYFPGQVSTRSLSIDDKKIRGYY